MIKVYIAAPLFNEEQINDIKQIERVLDNSGIEYYSPRSEGVLKQMSKEDRMKAMKRIYDTNVMRMDQCTHVVAIMNHKDQGTTFEIGYFAKSSKPIVLFADKLGLVNVMLAQAASACCTDITRLTAALKGEHNESVGDTE